MRVFILILMLAVVVQVEGAFPLSPAMFGQQVLRTNAPPTPTNSVWTGTVFHLKMEEASGTRADASPAGRDFMANGSPVSTNGIISNSLRLVAASSQTVSRADESAFDLTTNMTISCWIWINSLADNLTIASKWDYSTSGTWAFQTISTDELRIWINPLETSVGNDRADTTAANLTAAAWHHVVIVYDGNGATDALRLKCWVDGVAQTLSYNATVPSTMPNSSAAIRIGSFGGSLTRYFDGRIDEFTLLNALWTQTEVDYVYNSGAGRTYPN